MIYYWFLLATLNMLCVKCLIFLVEYFGNISDIIVRVSVINLLCYFNIQEINIHCSLEGKLSVTTDNTACDNFV